ncbi:hypothetical protein DERF_008643 [Dermatophagoides farinae]|uniref:Uncharacterized protein n=1 Tax=Dermatophagoides farinae TaxID=6954 RepID=A0A922I2U3_DERFA|nr:hypothetical protein DERF_008643 [Dermatophagoides farinae]
MVLHRPYTNHFHHKNVCKKQQQQQQNDKKHLFMDTFCMEYGGEENNKKDLKRHPYIQKYEL